MSSTAKSMAPPSTSEALSLTEGLLLDSSPLEPPRFHKNCRRWKLHQFFTAAEDPDRTKEEWSLPSFVRGRDPVAQREAVRVQELPLPSHEQSSGEFARILHGVLDEADCAALISCINAKGFTPALLNMGGGNQTLTPEVRDGFRVIIDSDDLASYLLEVLRPFIPEKWEGCPLVDLNNRCRFLCYVPGQAFEEHLDARYTHPSGKFSCVTVQIYLHDVPEENGGATTFLFNDGSSLPCQPTAGSVLMFSQGLPHEGSLLSSGLKYTLRTEAMYRSPSSRRAPQAAM